MNSNGYIYVMEDEPNICKIGFSKNFPTSRHKQISCLYHKDFKLLGFFKSEKVREDEKTIHKILEKYRIKGEWFRLSFPEIKEKLPFEFIEDSRLDNEEKDDSDLQMVTMRLPMKLLKEIDHAAKRNYTNRTAWMIEASRKKLKRQNEIKDG